MKKSLASLAFRGLLLAFLVSSQSALAQAPSNDNCSGAISLTLGAECTLGTNVGATTVVSDPPNCTAGDPWASAASGTVWYKVTIPHSGTYTFNLDNGTNQLAEDSQLKLAFGTCGGTGAFATDSVFCGEDAGTNANNTLAAMITKSFPSSGTYPMDVYLVVDIFGTTTGSFCINAYENVKASNDCISNATDITTDISAVTGANRFEKKAYFYNPPSNLGAGTQLSSDDPNRDIVDLSASAGSVHTDDKCNNNVSATVVNVYRGVWFKFTVSAGTPKTWLSVFPNNGGNVYVASLFTGTPSITLGACTDPEYTVNGLDYVDCSVSDGLNVNGDSYDKSKCSNIGAARLDISTLPSGTYYLRVSQFTKVLVDSVGGSQTNTPAEPDNGIFNITIEEAPTGTIGSDGLSSDKCLSANTLGCNSGQAIRNVTSIHTNLSNAGMTGNIFVANGGTACNTPNSNEPVELLATAGSSGTFKRNCTGGDITATIQHDLMNSAIYQFTIKDSVTTVMVSDQTVLHAIKSLIALLKGLSTNPTYQTLISTIESTLNTVNTTTIGALKAQLIQLRDDPAFNLGNPPLGQPALEALKDSIINQILALLDNLIVPVPTPFPCVASVALQFSNIKTAGVNGNVGFFHVVRADHCSSSAPSSMAGFTNSLDNCISLAPAAGKLPAGTYNIIVDGENGQLLKYDLSLTIQYKDSITGVDCGIACGAPNTLRKGYTSSVTSEAAPFAIEYIMPVPARDQIEVSYSSNTTENVKVMVMNIVGSKVYEGKLDAVAGNNKSSLDISAFNAGVYFLIIEKGDKRVFSKFVKSE